ncbi:hypothetical protein ACS04_03055 [Streptomyces roseus]|uniref:Uncharacterized protein n=1 Tax=Streptomyces roseus TaxID=66430 RepID=A0A0J6XV88_9ACTN|nr:hypothetical protein ACS04_03055 [Streptomyces roseus]
MDRCRFGIRLGVRFGFRFGFRLLVVGRRGRLLRGVRGQRFLLRFLLVLRRILVLVRRRRLRFQLTRGGGRQARVTPEVEHVNCVAPGGM